VTWPFALSHFGAGRKSKIDSFSHGYKYLCDEAMPDESGREAPFIGREIVAWRFIAVSDSIWGNTRDYLTAMAAVNAEVRVGCENDRIGNDFSHAHEASISEAHGNVCVFL
jgi:hypothetical protein